jgi:DNA gyrase/topoisomerase IV subunit B
VTQVEHLFTMPDGKAIAALLLGMIISHMKYLVVEGYVYIADMPLYFQNDKFFYISDGSYKNVDFTKPVTRFKGLID